MYCMAGQPAVLFICARSLMSTTRPLPQDSSSNDPLRTLYVACPNEGRPAKIGFTSDLAVRLPQLRRRLDMDVDYVWTASHPAAPEIEARIKATLSPLSVGEELFDTDADVLVAVAESEIRRFQDEINGRGTKGDLISFRLGAGAAERLVEWAEAQGCSVSAFLRDRVRAYLDGEITLGKPDSGMTVSRSFRLSSRQAQALRVRAGRQGRTCSELIRHLILDSSPSPAGGDEGRDLVSGDSPSGRAV